jgi:hypothetical protein
MDFFVGLLPILRRNQSKICSTAAHEHLINYVSVPHLLYLISETDLACQGVFFTI